MAPRSLCALALIVLLFVGPSCSDSGGGKRSTGEPCANNTDCGDNICHAGVCAASASSARANGGSCTSKAECRSFACSGGVCVAGSNPEGTGCLYGEECVQKVCTSGTCGGTTPSDGGGDGLRPDGQPPGSCTDETRNGKETDLDCGGGTCPACPNGKRCLAGSDCSSNACVSGTCRECVPGATKCQGRRVVTCDNGLWIIPNEECPSGCDPSAQKCRVCPASTCTSAKVIFWGSTKNKPDETVELAVDDGKVYRTSNDQDPKIGTQTALYGNFTADTKWWATDNVQCCVPTYESRVAIYYLAQKDGLAVPATGWYTYAGAEGYQDDCSSICCPNWGNTCYSAPHKIQKIEVQAYNGDPSCRVCLYNSTTLVESNIIKCLAPNTTIDDTEFTDPSKYPLVIRLDDGASCGSY